MKFKKDKKKEIAEKIYALLKTEQLSNEEKSKVLSYAYTNLREQIKINKD